MPGLSADALQKVTLKPVASSDRRDRSSAAEAVARGCTAEASMEEAARRDYFFSTGVEQWYSSLASVTFASVSVPLSCEEARTIVGFWREHGYKQDACPADAKGPPDLPEPPECLASLAARIDEAVRGFAGGAFVKLSTRSPKDSKVALRAAAEEYKRRCAAAEPPTSTEEANERIVLLAEAAAASLRVRSGTEALRLLLDSERVAEDLEFALEASTWTVAICVREWCTEVQLHSEWRGFVWDAQLNCLCQYYHPLRFPCLLEDGVAERVGGDVQAFFAEYVCPVLVKAGLERCIVDFAWLAPGRVLLVEVNPFDGVLGSFPVSTGLFLWDTEADRAVMQSGPFEVRVRKELLSLHETKDRMNPDWRRIIFGI